MLTARTIIKAMSGGAVLSIEYVKGEACYWLSDSKSRSHVKVSRSEGKQVSESSLVEQCDCGLLPGFAQTYVIKKA